MDKSYNVLIIGAGNIGAFYDTPSSENVLTHAHAFSKMKVFNLLGFVDVNKEKSIEASRIWNVEAFESIEEAFLRNDIDIISICVPDEYHYRILKKISLFPVKLIFTEKPLTKNLAEAKEIIDLYERSNINCIVNYSRRFVPQFEQIKNEIAEGIYGQFLCGNGYYGKGTLHNGSHLIDFLRYIYGEIKTTRTLNYSFDFYKDDASVSAILTFVGGKEFVIQNIPCSNYTIFEIDLLFEKRRVRIIDSGFKIEMFQVLNNDIFKGYKNLIKVSDNETSLGKALENAVTNIYDYLEYGEKLKCTIQDAYKVMEICESIKKSI